jgi:hypothetical protein
MESTTPQETQTDPSYRSPRRTLLIQPCIHAANAADVGTGSGDLRKVFGVPSKIDALCGVFWRNAFVFELGHLIDQIGQITLVGRDQALVGEGRAVPRQVHREVELLQLFQRGDLFAEESVAHVSEPAFHQVARADDALLRKIDDGVAARMATA